MTVSYPLPDPKRIAELKKFLAVLAEVEATISKRRARDWAKTHEADAQFVIWQRGGDPDS